MVVEIKAFGKISEIIDREILLDFPTNLKSLKIILEQQFPALSSIHYIIAINNEIVSDDNFVIENVKVLAIMPPFSGG